MTEETLLEAVNRLYEEAVERGLEDQADDIMDEALQSFMQLDSIWGGEGRRKKIWAD